MIVSAYISKEEIPEEINEMFIRIRKRFDLNPRAVQQRVVSFLARAKISACVAPSWLQKSKNIDIAVYGNINFKDVQRVIKRYEPELAKESRVKAVSRISQLKKCLRNRIREHLVSVNYIRIGSGTYVYQNHLLNKKHPFKLAFNAQVDIINKKLVIWIKHRYKYMESVFPVDLRRKNIQVRVLPKWSSGVITKSIRSAKEETTKYHGATIPIYEFWQKVYNYKFIAPNDLCVEVSFEEAGSVRRFKYPISCVFKEFKKRTKIPKFTKISPWDRVKYGRNIACEVLNNFKFLDHTFSFHGPVKINDLQMKSDRFENVDVVLRDPIDNGTLVISVNQIIDKLKSGDAIPYSGKQEIPFVIIAPSELADTPALNKFVKALIKEFDILQFGTLMPLDLVHENKEQKYIFFTDGATVEDYDNTLIDLKEKLSDEKQKLEKIAVLSVLPKSDASGEIYYRIHGSLFDQKILSAIPDFISQSIRQQTIEDEKYLTDKGISILQNIASQLYVKFGGPGSALWILNEPADISTLFKDSGGSCYGFWDASRRREKGTRASAYSALTDAYGRYITTGVRPAGGEKVTPDLFYDIIIYDVLSKINEYIRLLSKREESYILKRLVFAKDGIMRKEEAQAIREAIIDGIPDQKKPPLEDVLKKRKYLPDKLVIDLIGVNKSPKKNVFEVKNNKYYNPFRGTYVLETQKMGLLISSITNIGSVIPLEITHLERINVGTNYPEPSIKEILEEYYRLTFLDWSTLRKLPRLALPQKLTQLIGENITMGVKVPSHTLLL